VFANRRRVVREMIDSDVRGMQGDLWRISFVLTAGVLEQTYRFKMRCDANDRRVRCARIKN
jgi:hypothetical protein